MERSTSPQSKRGTAQLLRALGVVTRSLHVLTMALVVGGVAVGPADLRGRAMLAATASGAALLAVDRAAGRIAMTQGSGVLVLLKLALLGLAAVHPDLCLPALVAATLVACVGAHMPSSWRHFSVVTWHVIPREPRGQR